MNFYIQFNSHGAVAMTKEWVQLGMNMPEEELAFLIAEAMPSKMKTCFDTFKEEANKKLPYVSS